MPVKFSMPVIYGDENTKAALSSLDSLKSYLEEHPQASIFGIAQRDYIRDFLFQMYQDEVINKDGKVDQEKLADLLEIEVKIAANARAEIFDEDGSAQMDMRTAANPVYAYASDESFTGYTGWALYTERYHRN